MRSRSPHREVGGYALDVGTDVVLQHMGVLKVHFVERHHMRFCNLCTTRSGSSTSSGRFAALPSPPRNLSIHKQLTSSRVVFAWYHYGTRF